MVDCTKVRKMVINQLLPSGVVLQSIIYFDIDSGGQLTEAQVSKCTNVAALTFSCAVVCNPVV
jgi:hypothetical protein